MVTNIDVMFQPRTPLSKWTCIAGRSAVDCSHSHFFPGRSLLAAQPRRHRARLPVHVRRPARGHKLPWHIQPRASCSQYTNAMQEARPSVAHIATFAHAPAFLQLNPEVIRPGMGSGFLWDAQHVVTNFHVVQAAHRVKVTLSNQQTYDASVVGTDPSNDLAVLKLSSAPLNVRPIRIGTSHDLMVGQRVFAIGNPFGLDQTLTGAACSHCCLWNGTILRDYAILRCVEALSSSLTFTPLSTCLITDNIRAIRAASVSASTSLRSTNRACSIMWQNVDCSAVFF
jgi:hypothetical protein